MIYLYVQNFNKNVHDFHKKKKGLDFDKKLLGF